MGGEVEDGGDRWWCGRGGVDGEGDGSVESVVMVAKGLRCVAWQRCGG
ncbi:hypothetical protein Tco_0555161, partial [Tanacetum coccineum]